MDTPSILSLFHLFIVGEWGITDIWLYCKLTFGGRIS